MDHITHLLDDAAEMVIEDLKENLVGRHRSLASGSAKQVPKRVDADLPTRYHENGRVELLDDRRSGEREPWLELLALIYCRRPGPPVDKNVAPPSLRHGGDVPSLQALWRLLRADADRSHPQVEDFEIGVLVAVA